MADSNTIRPSSGSSGSGTVSGGDSGAGSSASSSKPAPQSLHDVGDPQRQAAWEKFQDRGITGSQREQVWTGMYDKLDAQHGVQGLSGSQLATVQQVVSELTSGSSGSGSSSGGSSSSSSSSGGSSAGGTLAQASDQQRQALWEGLHGAGLADNQRDAVWKNMYGAIGDGAKTAGLSDDQQQKVGGLVNTMGAPAFGPAGGSSGSSSSSSSGSGSGSSSAVSPTSGSGQGGAGGGSLKEASDQQRQALWEGLHGAGLADSQRDAVWQNMYGAIGDGAKTAGLSGDQQQKVSGLVSAMGTPAFGPAGGGTSSSGSSSSGSSSSSAVGSSSAASGSSAASSGPSGPDYKDDHGHTFTVPDQSALRENKGAMMDALKSEGASDTEVNQVMGMAMLETDHMKISEMQSWKNAAGAPPASNVFGPLNINRTLLTRLGVNDSDKNKLNSGSDKDSVAASARIALRGIRTMGFENYHKEVRGGTSGTDAYRTQTYNDALHRTIRRLEADPTLRHDGRRYGENSVPDA